MLYFYHYIYSFTLLFLFLALRFTNMSQSSGKSAAAQRLQKELQEIIMTDVEGISAFPDNDDLFNWIGTVQGVQETPYEGLEFQLRIKFPDTYPYQAPEVTFVTPCFHPNIDVHGTICLDILKEKWSAVQSASSILLSIQNLLNDPNNDSPLNHVAAKMWGENAEEYRKSVLRTYQSQAPLAA